MTHPDRRAFLIVLDSVGCGGAPDAADFGDEGANTLGHIARECAAGRADIGRAGPLQLPHLDALGLGLAITLASGETAPNLNTDPKGLWGAATEISNGKDTPSGHWEIAGVPVPFNWTYFPDTVPAFPQDVTDAICKAAGVDGILANGHRSGTVVIDEYAQEHIKTGWPICYTSVDSVLQIAAHEDHFGLQNLYDLCAAIAPMLHDMRVGRVIARPFVGDQKTGFTRTANRKDFALAPPSDTLCDMAQAAGRKVHAVGKIGDIFSMRGITDGVKGPDVDLFEAILGHVQTAEAGSLTFANLVEFDSEYGHRRDVAGYARHLEWFDAQIPRLMADMREGDLMIFTADHGNDPTWTGTDHTRERVPVIGIGAGCKAIGHVGFSDIGASIAAHLKLDYRGAGRSFL